MLRIVLVDDEEIFRDTLKFLLEKDSEIEVVGCASNVQESLNLCDTLTPDIVLMDIMMKGCNGIEGTSLIKAKHSSIKIIMLTTFDHDEKISKALINGADGYLLKEIDSRELILAIKTVAAGLSIVHKNVLSSVVRQIDVQEKTEVNYEKFSLTHRDLSIIELIVDGKSNKEIAAILFFTEGSMRNAISNILEKLKVSDRTQLAVFAIRNNLV